MAVIHTRDICYIYATHHLSHIIEEHSSLHIIEIYSTVLTVAIAAHGYDLSWHESQSLPTETKKKTNVAIQMHNLCFFMLILWQKIFVLSMFGHGNQENVFYVGACWPIKGGTCNCLLSISYAEGISGCSSKRDKYVVLCPLFWPLPQQHQSFQKSSKVFRLATTALNYHYFSILPAL